MPVPADVYVFTSDGVNAARVSLPRAAKALADGRWIMGLRQDFCTVADREACGFFELTVVPRPADTATTTHDRTVELVGGSWTVVWTERPYTAEEQAAYDARQARDARDVTLQQAISVLTTWAQQAANAPVIADLPNNQQTAETVARVDLLTDRLGMFFDRFADLLKQQYGVD